MATGRLADARARHAGALELASRVGGKYEQARAHDGLGTCYRASGRRPGPSGTGRKPTPCTPAWVLRKLT